MKIDQIEAGILTFDISMYVDIKFGGEIMLYLPLLCDCMYLLYNCTTTWKYDPCITEL